MKNKFIIFILLLASVNCYSRNKPFKENSLFSIPIYIHIIINKTDTICTYSIDFIGRTDYSDFILKWNDLYYYTHSSTIYEIYFTNIYNSYNIRYCRKNLNICVGISTIEYFRVCLILKF